MINNIVFKSNDFIHHDRQKITSILNDFQNFFDFLQILYKSVYSI